MLYFDRATARGYCATNPRHSLTTAAEPIMSK
jgi:hypothetical protein